jgi:ribosomal-protein-alanine N-acetyltransferase
MPVLRTERLDLCELEPSDAHFILRLTNTEGWLRYIGDRGVRSEDDAREYIERGPRAMYAQHGHGLWRIDRREDGRAIGMCGLIRRDSLPAPDLGFALLPEFAGLGYAREATVACIEFARERFGWPRLLAIVQADNQASLRLLRGLGFVDAASDETAGSEDALPLLRLCLGLDRLPAAV